MFFSVNLHVLRYLPLILLYLRKTQHGIYSPQDRKNWKKPFYLREFETQFRNRIFVIILVSLRSVFRIHRKKLGYFSSISLRTRRFENQFQIRFDDDIFFTKIKVAKIIKFREKTKSHVKFSKLIAVANSLFQFSEILKWQFLIKKKCKVIFFF